MNTFNQLTLMLDQQLKTQQELSKMNYTTPQIKHLQLPPQVVENTNNSLKEFIEPFVEVGFDAQQIKEELGYAGLRLVPLGHIESIISIIVGEQQ